MPMMINTNDRSRGRGPGTWDLLPRGAFGRARGATAPLRPMYSALLECPCTDRKKRTITAHATSERGQCAADSLVTSATECFDAAANLGLLPIVTNSSADAATAPPGCSVVPTHAGYEVTFNSNASSAVSCGPPAGLRGSTTRSSGHATVVGTVGVALDLDSRTNMSTIHIEGPADVWFGVGFDADAMADAPYALLVDGGGHVSERRLANHAEGTLLTSSVSVVSSNVVAGRRRVQIRRPLLGATPEHYTFDPSAGGLALIGAVGSGPRLGYHRHRGGAPLVLVEAGGPLCVCALPPGSASGSIDGVRFPPGGGCAHGNRSSLLAQKNDVCDIRTYTGGLKCCGHRSILLDAEQAQPAATDTYRMKFRIYYEPFVAQRHAFFMFITVGAGAGEYDVPQCRAGTPPAPCVYMTTAVFRLRDSIRKCHGNLADYWCAPNWNEESDVMLLRAGTHCHAPACINETLTVASTGEVLCINTPLYGAGVDPTMDEVAYAVGIPPCYWGSEPEGLRPPPRLALDTELRIVKYNNNTFYHTGVMAQWQMRGAFVDPLPAKAGIEREQMDRRP